MARRDRTTGLPRPRGRTNRDVSDHDGGWFPPKDEHLRYAILGGVTLLLVLVLGVFVYRWYDNNFQRPGKTILSAGEESFSLGYYSDRLGPFLISNPGTSSSIGPQLLLAKLEEEALTLQLATDLGIEITEDDITAAIAADLGVPVGSGSGSAFDNAYRLRLSGTGLSDGNYRRLTKASEADRLLREYVRNEIGETGETVQIRLVLVDTQESADEIVDRVNQGEDMGTIAQVESIHVQSRVEDGLLISPPSLLSDEAQEVLKDLEVGKLSAPFEDDDGFWVIRLERRDPEGTFTDQHLEELVILRFEEMIAKARSATEIERNLSPGDIDWALERIHIA